MKLERYDYVAVVELVKAAKSLTNYLEENDVYDAALDEGDMHPSSNVLLSGGYLMDRLQRMNEALEIFGVK